ncbi:MAG: hypothetical protein GY906_10265 [bacterium]|nr:hypothetical protein [bacterium]
MERLKRTRQLPNGDRLVEMGWVLAGFGKTRDSDPLELVNFDTAVEWLSEAFSITEVPDLGRPWVDTPQEPLPGLAVAHFKHFASGWVDELMVQLDRPHLIAACDALLHDLDDYPILDEDRYAEYEADDES